jgi:2-hydroxychromene-2-carboxylate isomerase
MTAIDYWLAPQSPFVYLGHEQFRAIAAEHRATIRVRPLDPTRLFAATGGLPLGQRHPTRQAYRLVELRRWSESRGLPMNVQPKHFPVDGAPASKLLLATIAAFGTERALDLVGVISRALWTEERDIADTDTLVALCNAIGLPGAMLMPASLTDGIAAELDKNTDAAIAAGVFGLPTFAIDGELFWGQDRLDFVARALANAG